MSLFFFTITLPPNSITTTTLTNNITTITLATNNTITTITMTATHTTITTTYNQIHPLNKQYNPSSLILLDTTHPL